MNCASCGMYVPAGADICPHCRTPIVIPGSSHTWNAQQVTFDYGTPATQAASRTPVRTDRTFIAWILLTVITAGFYHLYYVHRLAQDVNMMCADDGDHIGGLAAYLVFGWLTLGLYNAYWMYKVQKRLHAASVRYGVPAPWTGMTVLLWFTVGLLLFGVGPLVAMALVIRTSNEVAYAYNGGVAHS